MGGIYEGYGEGPLVGLNEVLVNRLVTQKRKVEHGELLTQTEDIIEKWKKHFEDLLNLPAMSIFEEAESVDSGEDESINRGHQR